MGVQLSLKVAMPLAGILATESDRCSKTAQGPVLLLRHDAVAIILANGSAAYFESCVAIGWNACDSISKTGPSAPCPLVPGQLVDGNLVKCVWREYACGASSLCKPAYHTEISVGLSLASVCETTSAHHWSAFAAVSFLIAAMLRHFFGIKMY